MTIEWVDRKESLPGFGVPVLAWGDVPCMPDSKAALNGCFLGETHFSAANMMFALDGTGHFGGVHVTHWSYINAPHKTDNGGF